MADTFESSEALAQAQLEKDTEAARTAGVTLDQFRAAGRFGMDAREYAAYDKRDALTIADVESIDAEMRAKGGAA